MYPVLWNFGGIQVTSFGLMMVLAILSGTSVLALQLRRWNLNPEFAWEVMPWVALGGILGAKLYYLLLHWSDLMADPLGELSSRSGLVWYGGLLGGIAAYYLLVRLRGLHAPTFFDATAPALALAYAVGRIGCFLVGDDYGLPTNSWVGIAFPNGSPPSTAGYLRSVGADLPASVPDGQVLAVHPTQLYEVGLALIIFAILWKVAARRLQPGRLFGLYLALYAIERFAIEFVRAKTDRVLLGLTTSQIVSLLLLGVAAYLWQRTPGTKVRPHPAPLHPGTEVRE